MKNKLNLTILIIVILTVQRVNSQSLAANGDFDSDITGWHCGSVNPVWISDDGSPESGNGSLQMSVENIIANGGSLRGGLCNWALVVPENNYKFEGYYKLPSNSDFSDVIIDLYWFTENESYVSVDSMLIPTSSITRDTWIKFTRNTSSPQDATKLSVSIGFFFNDNGQTESAFLRWDDLKVLEVPDNIFMNGFE